MNIFTRIRTLWHGFWETLLSKGEAANPRLLIEGTKRIYQAKLVEVKKTMTFLIYQQKKTELTVSKLNKKIQQLSLLAENQVREGQDKEAIHILNSIEELNQEKEFLQKQFIALEDNLKKAKDLEKKFRKKLFQSTGELNTLGHKIEILQSRKKLQNEVNSLNDSLEVGVPESAMRRLKDLSLQLEAEVEGHDFQGQEIDPLEKYESQLVEQGIHHKLQEIKLKVGRIQALPALELSPIGGVYAQK